MWKDDGHSRALIPKGEPLALQIRPPWGHVLARCYENKEVTAEDAHDANPKKMICCGIRKYIEIWKSNCLENETCREKNGGLRHILENCYKELSNFFPLMSPKLHLVSGH